MLNEVSYCRYITTYLPQNYLYKRMKFPANVQLADSKLKYHQKLPFYKGLIFTVR